MTEHRKEPGWMKMRIRVWEGILGIVEFAVKEMSEIDLIQGQGREVVGWGAIFTIVRP